MPSFAEFDKPIQFVSDVTESFVSTNLTIVLIIVAAFPTLSACRIAK